MLSDVAANGDPKKDPICCRSHWNLGSSARCGSRTGVFGEGNSALAVFRAGNPVVAPVPSEIPGHRDYHGAVAAAMLCCRSFQDCPRLPLSGQIPVNGTKTNVTPNGEGFSENANNRRLELQIRLTF